MNISNEDFGQLEALANAATPGDWVVDAKDIGAAFNIETVDGACAVAMALDISGDADLTQRKSNAAFVAAANPKTVLALVAALKNANDLSLRAASDRETELLDLISHIRGKSSCEDAWDDIDEVVPYKD